MRSPSRAWHELVNLAVRLLVARGHRVEVKGDLLELWHVRQRAGRRDLWRATARDVWGLRPIGPSRRMRKGVTGMWQDVKYAVRSWTHRPVSAVATMLTLALGIGSASAIFAAVDAVLLRPLPFPHPDRLVEVTTSPYRLGRQTRMSSGFLALPEIAAAGLWQSGGINLELGSHSERLPAASVDDGFFRALAVPPALGEWLPAPDGAARFAVISSRLWRARLGGERTIVGDTITLNGRPYTVAGVMPSGFGFPEDTDVWVSLGADFQVTGAVFAPRVIARLAPGVTYAQADAAAWAWEDRVRPASAGPPPAGPRSAAIEPLGALLVRAQRPTMILLGVSVAVLLLVVCASVANILLARVSARSREFTLRRALGASRWRLLRQSAAESCVMVVAGTAGGLLLASWGLSALGAVSPAVIGAVGLVSLDGRVLAIVTGVAAFTVVATSLVPGLLISDHGTPAVVRATGALRSRRSHRWRSSLVIAQIGLALVALCASVAAVTTLRRVSAIDLGFGETEAVAAQVVLPQSRYGSAPAIVSYLDRAVAAVQVVPGVRRAAVTGPLPGNREVGAGMRLTLAGAPVDGDVKLRSSSLLLASPDYFAVMGIRRIAGREFAPTDRLGSPPVIIISRNLAERLTGDPERAVGRIAEIPLRGARDQYEIVGVVADVLMRGAETDRASIEQFYLPVAQSPPYGTVSIVAEVERDAGAMAPAVADALTQVDPGVPAFAAQTVSGIADRYLAAYRLSGALVSTFALMTLVVAAVGLYGVMAQVVIERRREIGIRLALGAPYADVRRQLLGRGVFLTLSGVAIGLVTASGTVRALAAVVPSLDQVAAATFIVPTAVLIATALMAVWWPASRALSIDPVTILRDEH